MKLMDRWGMPSGLDRARAPGGQHVVDMLVELEAISVVAEGRRR